MSEVVTKEQIQPRYDIKFTDICTLKATPQSLIVRCVSIDGRRTLDQLFRAMHIDTKAMNMQVVYNDEEWAEASDYGKKTYLICSMGHFRLIGGNGYTYSSGPVHRDELVYADTRNNSNAMIVLDHELTFIPKLEEPKAVVHRRKQEEQDDNYLFHPATAKVANPPQLPKYNPDTCAYELTCSICGKAYPETEVSYTYSRENGYVYACHTCKPPRIKAKGETYIEKIARLSHTDLDNYSFDGSN